MERHKNLEDLLYYIGWILIALGSVFLWIYYRWLMPMVGINCVWDRLIGIYCPGCGGTRAVWSLLTGRFLNAVWYHPLVPYTAVIFTCFMVSQTFARVTKRRYTKGMRFHNWHLYVAIVLMIVNFLVKNTLRIFWDIML